MQIGTDGFFVRPMPSTSGLSAGEAPPHPETVPQALEDLLKDKRLRRMLSN